MSMCNIQCVNNNVNNVILMSIMSIFNIVIQWLISQYCVSINVYSINTIFNINIIKCNQCQCIQPMSIQYYSMTSMSINILMWLIFCQYSIEILSTNIIYSKWPILIIDNVNNVSLCQYKV